MPEYLIFFRTNYVTTTVPNGAPVTVTTTIYETPAGAQNLDKRADIKRRQDMATATPAGQDQQLASDMSSGCSCISIPPATTVTSTDSSHYVVSRAGKNVFVI